MILPIDALGNVTLVDRNTGLDHIGPAVSARETLLVATPGADGKQRYVLKEDWDGKVADPLDHDGNGKKGGSVPSQPAADLTVPEAPVDDLSAAKNVADLRFIAGEESITLPSGMNGRGKIEAFIRAARAERAAEAEQEPQA